MKIYRDIEVTENNTTSTVQQEIFDIHEAVYSGKDMGERKIDATVKYQSPIDFKIGDYMEIQIANLLGTDTEYERFYIQAIPTVKKISSVNSIGEAFEHHLSFYPAQYDLGIVQMRDCMQVQSNEKMQYTGYDEFSFIGGAHTLMRRIIYVLNERFGDTIGNGKPNGNPTAVELQTYTGWNYFISESVDEDINTALESFQFDFSGNTVMDALMKLNDESGINTTFFINGRTIYVGFKKSYICQVTQSGHNATPFIFMYGKTSHLKDVAGSTYNEKGGLYDITKEIGTQSPITRLYAYGSNKNLNRFYCSDRIKSGRYAAQLMLPSFMNDGKTDYIQSPQSVIDKYGIREGSKRWDDIYPTIKHVSYSDLREIKYVIRLEDSGNVGLTGTPSTSLATIRCYRVEPASLGSGVNKLIPAWPDKTLSIFVHATGKTVKCVLQGGVNAAANQRTQDSNRVPRNSSNQQIDGACYCVHMLDIEHNIGYSDGLSEHECTSRSQWFTNMDNPGSSLTNEQKEEINLHQIQYTDDYWGTDCFETEMNNGSPVYDDQTIFIRDNISFGCYPVINDNYTQNGSSFRNDPNTPIYEVVDVQPVTKEDTDANINSNQSHFYVYMRDIGFKVNQQAYSGQYNWLVQGDFNIEFLDGNMSGKSFSVTSDNDAGTNIVCLYNEDGTENSKWLSGDSELDTIIATRAKLNGAIWRFRCARNTENDHQWLPSAGFNPSSGNHVVFTNIYMPDVYILAAQNRLLKEAQKYLNDNDNGDISYALSMDNVRMAQQVELGRQMREGAVMRIVDDDLQIYTDNEMQELYRDSYGIWKKDSIISGTNLQYIVVPYFFTLRSNKHYKIVFDAGEIAKHSMGDGFIKLYNSLVSDTITYTPSNITIEYEQYKRNASTNRYTVEFDLPTSFNENYDYAIAVAFANSEQYNINQDVYLLEITESNLSGESVLKYVDLTIDQLTIKMLDGERSYSPTPSARTAPQTTTNNAINKQISATVKEKSKASGWTQLMNKIKDTSVESQINKDAIEDNVEIARRNYRMLDALRNNIFDPDGNVNEVFFRTMMLQIGADSMNYKLLKTYISEGKSHNINLYKDNNQWKIGFGYDTLYHNVFTTGNQSGVWNINATTNDFNLDNDKIYYIAIKCPIVGNTANWIVEESQPTKDKYEGYYVFNFGMIMSCESTDTIRFISETRGNVYVYGENVVLGRIATQDGSSFVDLIRNKIQFGDGFAYENGNLVLGSGVKIGTGGKTAADVLAEIGAKNAAQNAQTSANEALEEAQKTIGGENLVGESNPLTIADSSSNYNYKILVGRQGTSEYAINSSYLENGKKYVFSGMAELLGGGSTQFTAGIYDFENNIGTFSNVLPIGQDVSYVFEVPATGNYSFLVYAGVSGHTAGESVKFHNLMIQEGEKSTKYQEYVRHLTQAFEQTARDGITEVDGGLVISSLLQMRDPSSQVVNAGLSGITKDKNNNNENVLLWGGATYAQALNAALHNYYKSGISGDLIQTLIKKDGTGKIGCFRIVDNDTISVDNLYITKKTIAQVVPNQSYINNTEQGEIFNSDLQSTYITLQNTTIRTIHLLKGTYAINLVSGSLYIRLTATDSNVTYSISSISLRIRKNDTEYYTHQILTASSHTLIGSSSTDTWNDTLNFNTISNGSVTIPEDGDYTIEMVISGNLSYETTGSNPYSNVLITYSNFNYTLNNLNKYSVFAADGIAIIQDSKTQFYVYNNSTSLKVITHGLPTSSSNLVSGQLWNDGGTLKVV